MIVAMVVGVICLGASISAAFGDAKVISTALEGMARQPEVQGQLFTSMLIGVGLVGVHADYFHRYCLYVNCENWLIFMSD